MGNEKEIIDTIPGNIEGETVHIPVDPEKQQILPGEEASEKPMSAYNLLGRKSRERPKPGQVADVSPTEINPEHLPSKPQLDIKG